MSLLLVDGSWLCCSTWWASAPDTPERFAATIRRVAETVCAADAPVCAWDAPGSTWRRDLLPSYKTHRKPKPEALTLALLACRRLPGLRHVQAEGFEADDVLSTLALERSAAGGQVAILTADKDLAQIVSPTIRLVNAQGQLVGPAEVEARWGVPPARVRHLLSWCGDSSDGLPGVRGVGPKRAIPRALAGEIGCALTFDLVELARVPGLGLEVANETSRNPEAR